MTVEKHPFEPFLPDGARLLMLGTFPPAEKRWAMKFYYPNFTNDMWRIFGWCFFADKEHFVDQERKSYRQDAIKHFLTEHHIAMFDTATSVVRTKNTASDKDLQIVEETDLQSLLLHLPQCQAVLTAGQLATTVASRQMATAEPKMGQYVETTCCGRTMRLYRMPSSSRAYPMPIEQKAAYYQKAFEYLQLLNTHH